MNDEEFEKYLNKWQNIYLLLGAIVTLIAISLY